MKTRFSFIAIVILAAGCGGGPKVYTPVKRTVWLPTVRHSAPEPVYARTRWVQLPEVLPAREIPGEEPVELKSAPAMRPIFHMTLKNSNLEEAARVLAAIARYTAYCAPSLVNQAVSIDNLGSVDELAEIIGRKAEVNVVVDHENREVRILPLAAEDPRLPDE